MTNFLIKKIWRNKWLMLCLLMGNILLIGTAIGIPLYITATFQRVFQQDLRAVQENENRFPAVTSLSFDFNQVPEYLYEWNFDMTRNIWWPETVQSLNIPINKSIMSYSFSSWRFTPQTPREHPAAYRSANLLAVTGFMDNITLTHGTLPSERLESDNVIEALAMNMALLQRDLLLGEYMVLEESDYTPPLRLRIVGIFELPIESGAFWSVVPLNFENTLLISDLLVYEYFVRNYSPDFRMTVTWTEILDFRRMNFLNQELYEEAVFNAREFFDNTAAWTFSENFLDVVLGQGERTERLAVTLWMLLLPVFVMLALFIYMVSHQLLSIDQNVVSILKSRGVGRLQILMIYATQGFFVALVSFPAGLYLGIGICHFLGASNGFLDLVQREALQVFITTEALLFGLGAALFSFLTMFLPVIRFSKFGIHEHKTSNIGKPKKPLWQRFFIDILLFGFSIYSLYNINNQLEMLRIADMGLDPVLFLTSSMFMVGAALLCLRIFPYIVKLVFWLGKEKWPPSIYASMLKVIRSAGEEQFIMLFLVFTVSIGIFSAQAARTINLNNENMIQFTAGADLRFKESWEHNVPRGGLVGGVFVGSPDILMYTGPDFSRFEPLQQVESWTGVAMREGMIRAHRFSISPIQVIAIETDTFGETVWFRDDLLPIHLNYFLNTLGRNPDGVLLPDIYRTQLGLSVGDTISISEITALGMPSGDEIELTVMGFLEHFPRFPAATYRLDPETGERMLAAVHFAVMNLGHMQLHWGTRPIEVWMRTNTLTNLFFYDFVEYEGLVLTSFHDTKNELVFARQEPIIQGTNGALTISFIIILFICFVGFLIYWMLSIRSRVLQFGIFRAMGMGMRNILVLLFNEQMFITFTALVMGVVVGEASGRLFIPLIKVSYTPAEQILPLLVVMEARDYASIYVVLGAMFLICILILRRYISKIKIDQALKLGED